MAKLPDGQDGLEDNLGDDYASSFMRTWTAEKEILDAIRRKYLAHGESVGVDEVKRDLCFTRSVFRKYDTDTTSNRLLLNTQIRPVHNMLQRRERQLKGKKGKAGSVDQLFRKKKGSPVEQYLAEFEAAEAAVQGTAQGVVDQHPTQQTIASPAVVDLSTYRKSKGLHGVGVITEPGELGDIAKTEAADTEQGEETGGLEQVVAPQIIIPKRKIITPKRRVTYSTKQAKEEAKEIKRRDHIFDAELADLVNNRLAETIEFGKTFSVLDFAEYALSISHPLLYLDLVTSMTHQYGMTDTPILNSKGTQIGKTGINISFFGKAGTGKSYAIGDFILGNDEGIKRHGLGEGRNRECGGMTAARFVRIGEAYEGRRFNFIVKELQQWLGSRDSGATDRLKLAMEGGVITWETNNEKIGPYRFSSFFSVNYNPKITDEGYKSLVSDPNFDAIEDRMVNTLHKDTPEREAAVNSCIGRVEDGDIDFYLADAVSDHVMLVYAIQTGHEYVANLFPQKKILRGEAFKDRIGTAMDLILEQVREEKGEDCSMGFSSSRLRKKALRLAGAMSLMSYFNETEETGEGETGEKTVAGNATTTIQIVKPAIDYALRYLVTEAGVRGGSAIDVPYVLGQLGIE